MFHAMAKGLQEGTHYAKQLYLYGDGREKPVKNIERLSELSGVHVRTIRRHLHEWRTISTELSLNNPECPYTLALSEETLRQHREEIDFLGKEVVNLRREVQLQSRDKLPNYYIALQAYERALTKWEKSSGLLAHYNTAEAAMREKAKAHERAMAKQVPIDTVKRVIDKSKFDV